MKPPLTYLLKNLKTVVTLLLLAGILINPPACFSANEKWSGVDKSVVEKYANENGRVARAPFINTDQGDLLLFVFLLAGVLGGFVAGYYWRVIMDHKKTISQKKNKGAL